MKEGMGNIDEILVQHKDPNLDSIDFRMADTLLTPQKPKQYHNFDIDPTLDMTPEGELLGLSASKYEGKELFTYDKQIKGF